MKPDFNIENYTHKENTTENQQHFDNNKLKFNRQCQLVYNLFKRGKVLTTKNALLEYGIGDLRRRVKDLKDKHNIPVQNRMIKGKYKEYYIDQDYFKN